MRAEHRPALPLPGNPRDEVAGTRPSRSRRAVLVHLDTQFTELPEHVVGNGSLGPRRARDLAEPDEPVEHSLVVTHGAEGYALAGLDPGPDRD